MQLPRKYMNRWPYYWAPETLFLIFNMSFDYTITTRENVSSQFYYLEHLKHLRQGKFWFFLGHLRDISFKR